MRLAWSRSCRSQEQGGESELETATQATKWRVACRVQQQLFGAPVLAPGKKGRRVCTAAMHPHLCHHSVAHSVVEGDAVLVVLAVDQVVQPLHTCGGWGRVQVCRCKLAGPIKGWGSGWDKGPSSAYHALHGMPAATVHPLPAHPRAAASSPWPLPPGAAASPG